MKIKYAFKQYCYKKENRMLKFEEMVNANVLRFLQLESPFFVHLRLQYIEAPV